MGRADFPQRPFPFSNKFLIHETRIYMYLRENFWWLRPKSITAADTCRRKRLRPPPTLMSSFQSESQQPHPHHKSYKKQKYIHNNK